MYKSRILSTSGRLPLLLIAAFMPLCAQQVFGPNLILNGDAESGPGSQNDAQVSSIPNWTNTGANVIVYASAYGLDTGSILPASVGKNYFSSGKSNSNLTQTVNLAASSAAIDLGNAVYTVSGYFGGYSDHDDTASLTVTYLGANNNSLGAVTIGGVKSADRYGTGLYFRRQIGLVPAGTRSATVTLSFALATASSNNNAYADNLSLVLNTPAAGGSVPGPQSDCERRCRGRFADTAECECSARRSGLGQSFQFHHRHLCKQWRRSAKTTRVPADRGKLLFLGGPSNDSSNAYQDIDISPLAAQVDAGAVKFAFGAWIGGFSSQGDYAVLSARFMNWAGTALGPRS